MIFRFQKKDRAPLLAGRPRERHAGVAFFPAAALMGAILSLTACLGGPPSQTLLEINQIKRAVTDLQRTQEDSFRKLEYSLTKMQQDHESQRDAIAALREDMERQLAELRRGMTPGVAAEPGVTPMSPMGETVSPPAATSSEDEVFRQAEEQYSLGNYDRAIALYNAYLDEHGQSANAPEAAMRLGRCYFLQKNFQEARDAYARVERDYPASPRVPLALHSKGICEIQLNDTPAARATFETLRRDYPSYEPELISQILETYIQAR